MKMKGVSIKGLARLALIAILAVFVLLQIATCIEKGGQPLRRLDAQSERNSWQGAERFVTEGFRSTSFLARYDSPLNLDSGSPVIRDSDIYTHYFPGPDYVLAAVQALFGPGETVMRWSRLLPLAHVLVALLLLLGLSERRLWPGQEWITTVMAALALYPPVLRDWSLSLHGHSYSSAYIMLGLGLGLLGEEGRHRPWRLAAGFVLGILSNYMLLTGAFVVCAAPLVGSLLVPDRRRHGFAVVLSGMVGLGLVIAFGVHYLQIVDQFGWHEARLDQFGVFSARAGAGVAGTSRNELFSQYQTEVQRYFGITPVVMLLIGLWGSLGYAGSARARLAPGLGVALAFAGSWAWIFLMRQHSLEHGHVNPRIFLLIYLCSLATAGRLGAGRGKI